MKKAEGAGFVGRWNRGSVGTSGKDSKKTSSSSTMVVGETLDKPVKGPRKGAIAEQQQQQQSSSEDPFKEPTYEPGAQLVKSVSKVLSTFV